MKAGILKEGSKIPVFLSALVFPGLGQFMQKRWVAGAVYASLFLVAFLTFCILILALLINYYRLGFEFDTYEPQKVHWLALLLSFLLAFLIYLANVVDTAVAQFRAGKKRELCPDDFLEDDS
jgi:uncharacterized membrane protein YkvI